MKDNQQIELADLLVKKIVAEEVDKKYESNVCELKDMVSLCFDEVSNLANQVNNIAPALFNIPKSELESQLQPNQHRFCETVLPTALHQSHGHRIAMLPCCLHTLCNVVHMFAHSIVYPNNASTEHCKSKASPCTI